MRKRITSLLLVLALCLTLLPTAALAEASSLAAQEARGGTENGEDYTVGEDTAVRARTRAAATGEVYRISNADDLEAFCKRVNGGESSLNAVLVKDVSRNKNYSWESIKGYTGVFDGNGHTITLRVGGRGENNALFGSIASGGTVQDLTIQIYNWSVNISSATGSIAYSNNGTIQRCQALDWTGEKNIGGIVYHNESEGVVKDCRAGTLTLSKSRENLVGGIAFINDGLIQDCYVSGRLQSTSSGSRGDLSSATAIVRTNSGTVETATICSMTARQPLPVRPSQTRRPSPPARRPTSSTGKGQSRTASGGRTSPATRTALTPTGSPWRTPPTAGSIMTARAAAIIA